MVDEASEMKAVHLGKLGRRLGEWVLNVLRDQAQPPYLPLLTTLSFPTFLPSTRLLCQIPWPHAQLMACITVPLPEYSSLGSWFNPLLLQESAQLTTG